MVQAVTGDPLVSIVIPVFNGADYLHEAIDSALAQTYRQIEVIVVNDGSADGGATERIAVSYGDRIRYIAKENGGVASALNRGIQEMRGEYFAWLSHDDVYYPEKTAIQIEAMRKFGMPVVLYSDLDVIDKSSVILKRHRLSKKTSADVIWGLLTCSSVNGCTTLIPRKCFSVVGVFDETLRTTQDFDLWFRMTRHFDFVHLPQALIQSRVHSGQGSLTISGHRQAENALYIKALSELPTSYVESRLRESGAVFFVQLAFHLRRRGFDQAADFARELAEKHGQLGENGGLSRVLFWSMLDLLVRLGFQAKIIRKAAKKINRILRIVD